VGDPRRLRKKWKGPRHPWRKEVLAEEIRILGEYGLRNKRELWRAKTMLRKFRARARAILALPPDRKAAEEKMLIGKLAKLGLLDETASLDDVLRLTVEDILERRLQTIVYKKGLAKTIYHARQLITHRHIVVGDRIVTSPGRIITRDEEALVDYAPRSPYRKMAVREEAVGGEESVAASEEA